MTQKELLYLEDAVMHEKNIIGILNNMIESLSDEDLISFSEKELKKHQNNFEKLNDLLEEKANE